MTEEVQFIGPEQYQGGNTEGLTFRQIIMNQLSRITKIQSQELRGGYYKEIYIGGATNRVYVPDTRQAYMNGVKNLNDILFAHFDEKMTKFFEEFNDDLDKYYDQSIVKLKNKEKGYSDQTYWNVVAGKYRKLFRALILLLKRLQYLEGATFEEEL